MSEFDEKANPYESPLGDQPRTIPITNRPNEQRPTSVTVFGILNIVMGLLGLCGLGFSGLYMFLQSNPTLNLPPNPVFEIMRTSTGYFGFMVVSTVLGLLFTIVLIVAGIQLLMGKQSGRKLSIVYAIYAILGAIAGMIANIVFVFGPMLNDPNGNPAMIGGIVGGIVGGMVGLMYPVVLWFFMTRPYVIAALK